MRLSFLAAFGVLAALLVPVHGAQAGSSPACAAGATSGCTLVGEACSSLGQTRMDNDQKSIVSCVCTTTTNCGSGSSDLKWAAMGGGSGSCSQQHPTQACGQDGSRCGCTNQQVYVRHQGYVTQCVANSCCWANSTVGPSPNGTLVTLSATGGSYYSGIEVDSGSNGSSSYAGCMGGTWMCWSAGYNQGYGISTGSPSPCASY
jgi:hypothetical protein